MHITYAPISLQQKQKAIKYCQRFDTSHGTKDQTTVVSDLWASQNLSKVVARGAGASIPCGRQEQAIGHMLNPFQRSPITLG